jgi:hypothetical protein
MRMFRGSTSSCGRMGLSSTCADSRYLHTLCNYSQCVGCTCLFQVALQAAASQLKHLTEKHKGMPRYCQHAIAQLHKAMLLHHISAPCNTIKQSNVLQCH